MLVCKILRLIKTEYDHMDLPLLKRIYFAYQSMQRTFVTAAPLMPLITEINSEIKDFCKKVPRRARLALITHSNGKSFVVRCFSYRDFG